MTLSRGNVQSESAKMEQIITEFFAKSLHIILESRCVYMSSRHFSGEQTLSSPSSTSSSSSSSVRLRDKWFNLALRECPAALENIDFWRQSNLEPMVVDVVLVQQPSGCDSMRNSPMKVLDRTNSLRERGQNYWHSNQEEYGCEPKSEKILERWVVHYETRKSKEISSGSKRPSSTSSHNVYKKSILLLRSLYLTVRILPAYKLFRDLNSSGQLRNYTLVHRVSSLVEPFTRREELEMKQYGFTPIDTSCGRLCLSLLYRSSISGISSVPSIPMSPKFIPDYVGSPLADRLKRFPSLPVTRMVSHSSPSSTPFSRRHSLSSDFNASPPSGSYTSSSSTAYPEYNATVPSSSFGRIPPNNRSSNFDDNWSPSFSPSASPSQSHLHGSHPSKDHLHSGPGSPPLAIPTARLSITTASSGELGVPPSPPMRGLRPSSLKTEKMFTRRKEETGKSLAGVKLSSNSLHRVSFSRSSSTLSLQDDFDDSEFSCAFDVSDDDITNPGSRPESFDPKGHHAYSYPESGGQYPVRISQDAAVGALVRMLKRAPPLREDSSKSGNVVAQQTTKFSAEQAVAPSIVSSTLLGKKTTSDALHELQSYREMKNMLLSQSKKMPDSA